MWENKGWVRIGREETITVLTCCCSTGKHQPWIQSLQLVSTLRAKAEAQEEDLVTRKSNRVLKLYLVPPKVWLSVPRKATIINGYVWKGFRELEILGGGILQAEKLSLQHTIRPDYVSFQISSSRDCRDTAAFPFVVICRNTDHLEHRVCSSTALFLGSVVTPSLNSCSEISRDSHFLVLLSF